MIRRTVLIMTLLTTFFLVASGGASAQDLGLVSTSIQYTTEEPLGPTDLWDGRSIMGRVDVDYCWGAEGGFNPTSESFDLHIAASAPSWVAATVNPETMTVSPPMGPTTEPGCERAGSIDVSISANDLLNDQQVLVTVAMIPAAAGSPLPDDVPVPVPATGTFDAPGSVSAGFSFRSVPAPAQGGNGAPTTPPGGSDFGGGAAPVDSNDTPAPAFAFLAVLVVALVALRRRE